MGRRNIEGFIGAYAPPYLKKKLQESAKAEHRTLSQEVIRRLTVSVFGEALSFEEVVKQETKQ